MASEDTMYEIPLSVLRAERAAHAAQTKRVAKLRHLLTEFMYMCDGDEACSLDHHGFCQTHASGPPCLMVDARALLEETKKHE